MEIKPILPIHYPQVSSVYLQGIATGVTTFETTAPAWEDWDRNHLHDCRIGVFEYDKLSGWTALSKVSSRWVYRGVAELSVFVAEGYRGRGLGKLLLQELIVQSEAVGIWTLQSAIMADNFASISLHEKCGFRKIGFREKVGQLGIVWKDNLMMERRSKNVGV